MIDLAKFLVTQIVDDPDAVKIDSQLDQNGTTILTVSVGPNDMGKVIGRGGKIINAIRELVKVKAIKSNQRVRVILADPENTTQTDSLSLTEPEE
jgi:hypothetical protein